MPCAHGAVALCHELAGSIDTGRFLQCTAQSGGQWEYKQSVMRQKLKKKKKKDCLMALQQAYSGWTKN